MNSFPNINKDDMFLLNIRNGKLKKVLIAGKIEKVGFS